jgi:hypothetical protein
MNNLNCFEIFPNFLFNSQYKSVVPDDYFTAYTTVNPMSEVGTICKFIFI